MKRAPIAALILTAGLGGLCALWYASSQRALDAELREREQRALNTSAERERAIAENLSRRLEELRVAESERPYFHYQNLYHDPKGASEGLSIVPSPLATGTNDALVVAYFQIDAGNRVTLPTLNEEMRELSAPNAPEQASIRDLLAPSALAMRNAAKPLLNALETEDTKARATAARIADLEERLAASQSETTRRQLIAAQQEKLQKKVADTQKKVDTQKNSAEPQKAAADLQQNVSIIDTGAFQQNLRSNDVYRELKRNASNDRGNTVASQAAAPPQATAANATTVSQAPQQQAAAPNIAPNTFVATPIVVPPRRASPVEIRTSDLQWQTIEIGRVARLVALRGVRTPAGNFVQGLLTPLAENATFEGARVLRAKGASIAGTGWRVQIDPAAILGVIHRDETHVRERFLRMFTGVIALFVLVIAGIVWMVSRSEALAMEKTRFAATAAHELRTPLASLRLYSEMIADERDPVRRERYAREISGQTERLGRLVANVLEVTRIERGTFKLQPREGEIGRAIADCVEKLRPQMDAAGCPIELRIASDLPRVAFDEDALEQIVDNLLDNAEKYSREAAERNIVVDVAPHDGGVAITVSDRGPGLPTEVFRDAKPFRRSAGGLGLGLFLVDRIVRGHGGAIRSKSRDGGGASVQIFLPAFYKA
ncbi:MAG TPA: ATP-binding protein [Thermoanaerobaculia bacterium]|nr:ATP-binding protein [Thermoanaerobaculia bacterium]